MRLEGKVAIITGATIGIGRASAVAFAREGARVVATGRNETEGARTVEQVEAAGGAAEFVRQDIGDEGGWAALIERVEARHGGLDVLVNNAGMFFIKPLAEIGVEDFEAIYRVNVEGTFLGMKYAMPALERRGGGSIVNVSSLLGRLGFPGGAAYCATKGAVTQMSYGAAREGAGRGIRVNVVHPGVIWTKMVVEQMGADEDVRAFLAEETPMKRLGTPEDIAGPIVYLASDAARYVTGAELTVDGGRGAD